MPIELIIRGDDAGATVSANRAIAQCFDKGVLTCTSVMAVGGCESSLADAAERLRPLVDRGLCVGLHATLNSEWDSLKFRPTLPAEQVASLIDDNGCFLRSPKLLGERSFEISEAVAEVMGQLARLRAAGFEPSYLDEHMFVGRLPGLRDALCELAEREGLIPAVPFVPSLPRAETATGDVIETLASRLARIKQGRYVWVTHPMWGEGLADGMTNIDHPAGRVSASRDREREALVDARLRSVLEQAGVQRITYPQAAAGIL